MAAAAAAAVAAAAVPDLLIPFCDAGSIDIKDIASTVKKRLLVSLSFVDHVAMHQALFPSHHADWQGIQDYLAETNFTASEWMHLISALSFVGEQAPRHHVSELVASALAGARLNTSNTNSMNQAATMTMSPIDTLRICYARANMQPSWDTLCKSLVMCNLTDIDSMHALQALNPHSQFDRIADLVRFLPSCKHTREEYTDTFVQLLQACDVRTQPLAEAIRNKEIQMQLQRSNVQKHARTTSKKPSITAFIEARRLREGSENTQDSIDAFRRTAKLSSHSNERVSQVATAAVLVLIWAVTLLRWQVAYYLVCLPISAYSEIETQIARVVGGDRIVQDAIRNMSAIVTPDIKAIRNLISDVKHVGAPFDMLRRFREECIPGSLVTTSGKRVVNWTIVLRLYLAAYCRPKIYKDIWVHILSVGNHGGRLHTAPETDSAVQAFTRANPIALEAAVSLMMAR